MANPSEKLITADTWVKIADGVKAVKLWNKKADVKYLYTFRIAGFDAPTDDGEEGALIFRDNEPDFEELQFNGSTDLYLYCAGGSGKIRLDLNAGMSTASGSSLNTKIPVDNFFLQANDVATTLVTSAAVEGKQIQVTDPSSFSIGDVVVITNPQSIYFGEALAVAGDIITLDSRLTFAYPAGNTVQSFTKDLNVDGSVTPQVFSIFGPGAAFVKLNITRLVWNCLTTASVDLSKFGDIAGGITNGCLLRGVPNPASGIAASNQLNIKANSDLDTITGGDFKVAAATNPAQGQDGFTARYTYGNPDKHDTVPGLSVGDRIDFIINDSLLTLLKFRMLFAGNQEFLT